MANAQTLNPWRIDTCGVLSTTPVCVKKVILYPNAAGDAAALVSWDVSATKKATMTNQTVTTTSTTTIASTGNFETAEVAVGDIIRITNSSTGNNLTTGVVSARSDDNTVVLYGGNALTNEASKVYSWWTLTPQVTIPVLSPGTEKIEWIIDFGSGLFLPNLALQSISTSAIVYIYV